MNGYASLNHVFRLGWNESLNTYVLAAETAWGTSTRVKGAQP